ncbi:hypothetical protein OBBRIDRAFT_723698 [Obba rivulosa]|uniref:Uncharacterized protein n=1 Tax=Obba rivulosa TaxID=1052685 RepID=A0A8E2DQM8_9APHY|nr:hypothetical protein OBBRIDRAFT_723698 [Obba rivulosa]
MFVPFLTPRTPKKGLYPRKGGGGGGKGGGSSSSGSKGGSSGSKGGTSGSKGGTQKGNGGSSGSSGTSSSGKQSTVPISGATGGRSSAVSYGGGGGKVTTIPAGQPFAGRTAGGASRAQVYGTAAYGSGYPGASGLGVSNRGFPFFFWPVVWGTGLGYGAAYLYDSEYGLPSNSSRPGGPMAQAAFVSNSTNSTFHVLADNSTVASLISAIDSNCTVGSSSSTTPSPYDGANASQPRPEQVIQYYRASSVALTLDGYNNTDALTGNENSTVPIPSWVDASLLNCLNDTIGEAVPLISGAGARLQLPGLSLFVFLWLLCSQIC